MIVTAIVFLVIGFIIGMMAQQYMDIGRED